MKRKVLAVLLACILALGIGMPVLPVLADDGDAFDYEIVVLRDQYSKTYKTLDNNLARVISIGSIHYEDEFGDFQVIDTTITPSNNPNWDWQVTTGHWKLFVNNDTTVGVKKGDNWIGTRLHGIAYYDASIDDYTILQTANSVIPVVKDNTITWYDILYGVDYVLYYTNDSLKEDVIIHQEARDLLSSAGHRPSDYGYSASTTFLVPIWECDWSESLQMKLRWDDLDHEVEVNPDDIDTTRAIHFEADVEDPYWKTKLVSFLPVYKAISVNPINPEDPEDEWEYAECVMKKRLVLKNDKHWLLTGVPVLELNAMPEGSIIFDPTETLRPNGAGDETNCGIGGTVPAATNWESVDEAVADENTTFVHGGPPVFFRDLYNLPAHAAGTGEINKITLHFRVAGLTDFTNAKGVIKSNGDVTETAEKDPFTDFGGGNWGTYDQDWATNPADAGDWEWADIDALQIGVSLKSWNPIDSMRCTQVYVVVDYTAATAPAITTDAATYVAKTTARLNSTVDDDGLEACDVRFGYGTTTQANVAAYDTQTAWVEDTYTTGQHPFVNIDSLNPNDEYFFRVAIRNDHSTVEGGQLTFDTLVDVDPPTNLKAYPASTSIGLTWTRGVGATETLVRWSEVDYPADETEGTQAYLGTGGSCTISGLTIGHTYYIVGIGKSGADYSGTTEVMATTTAAAAAPAEPGAPDEPEGFFQDPDPTGLVNFPGYSTLNTIADNLNVPFTTMWTYMVLLFIGIAGFIFYAISHSMMVVMVVIAVGITWGSLVGVLPLWMMFLVVLLGLGLFQLQRRGT